MACASDRNTEPRYQHQRFWTKSREKGDDCLEEHTFILEISDYDQVVIAVEHNTVNGTV